MDASGAELKAYAERCVERYGLRSRIRLNTRVLAAGMAALIAVLGTPHFPLATLVA